MKKFFVMLMVAIAAIACEEEPVIPAIEFDKAGSEIYIETAGTDGLEVSFNSNVAWTASITEAEGAWVVVSPKEGLAGDAVVKIIADENKTNENRTAKLVITAGEGPQAVVAEATLVQYQLDAFELVETSAEFDQAGGTAAIKVMTNVDFTVTIPEDAKSWLTAVGSKAYGEKTYEISVAALPDLDAERTADITVSAEGFEDLTYTISQNGPKSLIWSKNVTELDGYTTGGESKLAAYGEKLLVSNLTKILVLNPSTGAVEQTISLPEGFTCNDLCVDEGGNVLIASHAKWSGTPEECGIVTVYTVKNLQDTPKELIKYHTGNIWSSTTGNIRVKGNIDEQAVITAYVGAPDNPYTGYWLAWEAANGSVAVDENGWSVFKYGATNCLGGNGANNGCVLPEGNTLDKGLWFIGYAGDYNLKYCADPTTNAFVTSYTTGSTWMENYNCIARATWNGKEYAAIVAGCHFDYDAADVLLLDVTNPAAATKVFAVDCDSFVDRDADWKNLDWTGAGSYSDVLLVPTTDALMIYYVDVNFNIIGCSQYK